MPIFTKKPVRVEARQLRFGANASANEICGWIMDQNPACDPRLDNERRSLTIHTLEGDHEAGDGDWIIQGIKGEFYPCKPDIFNESYDLVFGRSMAPTQKG
jgi:hypothetical protein